MSLRLAARPPTITPEGDLVFELLVLRDLLIDLSDSYV
jgi:hypothetical protein